MSDLLDVHAIPFNLENPALDFGSTTQVIAAVGDTLVPVGGLLKISSAAVAFVLNGTPTIATANAKAGDVLTILNVNARGNATDYFTFARGAATALKLGAATRVLQTYGSLKLVFDGAYWVEITHTLTAKLA